MSRTYSPNRLTRAVPYGLSLATWAGVTANPSSTVAYRTTVNVVASTPSMLAW